MTSKNLLEMPDFNDFYEVVHKRQPFPWQKRLAEEISEKAEWPSEIGVPTGLGKTACLDIAVWWLASQAHLRPEERFAPTRIWWVVNRRLLVDEASKHAKHLQQMLEPPEDDERPTEAQDVLTRIAVRLRHLAGSPDSGEALHVIPMRGGIALRRPPNPVQPTVIVSTIPMYGSRLLFRGFGSSCSMHPVDAALAGTDALVLIDEAHLARHLRDLMPKLRQCIPEEAHGLLLPVQRSTPQVVSLTATGDASRGDRFDLDESDRKHEIIKRRLNAHKPVEINAKQSGDISKAIHGAVVQVLKDAEPPASCVAFCNTPAVARSVYELLRSHKIGKDSELMLVTGRVRQADADKLKDRLLSPATGIRAGSSRAAKSEPAHGQLPFGPSDASSADNNGIDTPKRERHLIVVATQTLEVGADLDFEYLVTEQCGVRALTQRLGRLNRLGEHERTRAVYVHRPPPRGLHRTPEKGMWPVYGEEPKQVLERLQEHESEGQVELSPQVVASRLGKPGDDPGRAPEVLPGLLWEWVKTTTPPHGEAPVEPYFSGIAEPQRSVSVIWRAYIPGDSKHDSPDESREGADLAEEYAEDQTPDREQRLWPRLSQDEVADIPLGELLQAFNKRRIEQVARLQHDHKLVETVELNGLRKGDLVVLHTSDSMYDEFGWAPGSNAPVLDLSIQRSGLPLNLEALRSLFGVSESGDLSGKVGEALNQALGKDQEESDELAQREAAEKLIALLRECDMAGFTSEDQNVFLDSLEPTLVSPQGEVPRLELKKHDGESSSIPADDDSDEMSLSGELKAKNRELREHGRLVGERVSRFAELLGLPASLCDVLRKAGEFHDIGKADDRFQCWLDPDSDVDEPNRVLLAKSKKDMPRSLWSTTRAAARWPRGGRHEELSARLVKAWLSSEDRDLVDAESDLLLHLVVSHHGKGRPLVTPVPDDCAEPVHWEFADGSQESENADLSQTDWEQPARFHRLNEQYGPWSLALLEALLRQADHQESSLTNEVQ